MLKIVHPCGYVKDFEFLCPNCHLPWCEEDTQQVTGGLLAGSVVANIRIDNLENVKLITDNYTILNADAHILVNNTEDIEVTLPISNQVIGREFSIKKLSVKAKKIMIIPQTGTIDGDNDYKIPNKYDCVTLISDGVNWFII